MEYLNKKLRFNKYFIKQDLYFYFCDKILLEI